MKFKNTGALKIMKKKRILITGIITMSAMLIGLTTCGVIHYKDAGKPLAVEEISEDLYFDEQGDDNYEIVTDPQTGYNPLFSNPLGVPVSKMNVGLIPPEETGLRLVDDYDGDGIANEDSDTFGASSQGNEAASNDLVADYPRVVTRVTAPITMEIRRSVTEVTENHTETLEESDFEKSIKNSMEDKNYTELNHKTVNYVTKEAQEQSYGYEQEDGYSDLDAGSGSMSGSYSIAGVKVAGISGSYSYSDEHSENHKMAENFSSSSMSQGMNFENVDFVDNLDKHGVEFRQDTVQRMSTNFRQNEKMKNKEEIGPDDGYVRANLFIKNLTVNMPVRVSNILCTLSFRTPAGVYLPVKTFRLRNDDWSIYSQDIAGGDEFGPYVVEFDNLNTYEVMNALERGYVPQIHVVSYDLEKVEDSNYNPGVNNLKIVEEIAKARTAFIKISGTNYRESYRVCAFDVTEVEGETVFIPGVSLKKALFNIFADRIGDGEQWENDLAGNNLTVPDSGLKWRSEFEAGEVDGKKIYEHQFTDALKSGTGNDGKVFKGNKWRLFETEVKSYQDEAMQTKYIETIKRIGHTSFGLSKYNPFDIDDNDNYDVNTLLSEEEVRKMKYWVILHNGRYFEGDINDPIWVGERYELICVDIDDYNNHFDTFNYTPIQSMEKFYLSTRWNARNNDNEFDRAIFLGRIIPGEVIKLDVDLALTRYLFNPNAVEMGFGIPQAFINDGSFPIAQGAAYYEFTRDNYTFHRLQDDKQGIPRTFEHSASGGTNNITVEIDDTEFTHLYEIKITAVDASGNLISGMAENRRYVLISREALLERGGKTVITRKTKQYSEITDIFDLQGNGIGTEITDENNRIFSASVNGLDVYYKIEVRAHGINWGYPVYTKSITRDVEAEVTDSTADENADLSGFSFGAYGLTEAIRFNISRVAQAEYYTVYFEGPLNYGYEGDQPGSGLNGHSATQSAPANAGYNVIPVTDIPVEITDPGIYRVWAEAHGGGFTGTSLDDGQYVSVFFNPYDNDKSLLPRRSYEFSNIDAVDLEVNFNDGSGWWRLKTSFDDAAGVMNFIDVRETSHIDYNDQKFHILFRPPHFSDGAEDNDLYCEFNVFHGGKEYVDVYIRTVPENKYRDTFWIKPNEDNGTFMPNNQDISAPDEPAKYIYVSQIQDGLNEKCMPLYWINNPLTDATNIEDVLADYGTGMRRFGDLFAINEYFEFPEDGSIGETIDFGVVVPGVPGEDIRNNFFYSPMEERVYAVRASKQYFMPPSGSTTNQIARPTFRAIPGNKCIHIVDLNSPNAGHIIGSMGPCYDPDGDIEDPDVDDVCWEDIIDPNPFSPGDTGYDPDYSKQIIYKVYWEQGDASLKDVEDFVYSADIAIPDDKKITSNLDDVPDLGFIIGDDDGGPDNPLLTPGEQYTVAVVAYGTYKYTAYDADAGADVTKIGVAHSDPVYRVGVVPYNSEQPAAPEALTLTLLDADSVKADFTDTQKDTVYYGIYWKEDDPGAQWGYAEVLRNGDEDDYTYTIDGLDLAGDFRVDVKVCAVNKIGLRGNFARNTVCSAGYNETLTIAGVDFNMKFVPGGTFPTGTVDSGTAAAGRFWMAETEVTYELWYAVRAWAVSNGYTFANAGMEGNDGTAGAAPTAAKFEPVTTINWRDSIVWCNALTEYYNAENGTAPDLDCVYYTDAAYTAPLRTATNSTTITYTTPGTQDMPYIKALTDGNTDPAECTAKGFRLPESMEWECAARYRGTDTTNTVQTVIDDIDFSNPADGIFWTTGNSASGAYTYHNDVNDLNPANGIYDGKEANDTVAVYYRYWDGNSWEATGVTSTAEIASKAANALGLYDVSGNVREWCFSIYSGSYRVLRGGGWSYYAGTLLVGHVGSHSPYIENSLIGFRPVRTP